MHALIREKTRILRPCEYKQLCNAVPKKDFKTMLNALLLSGMRYVEMQRFQRNPEWFDGEFNGHIPLRDGFLQLDLLEKKNGMGI